MSYWWGTPSSVSTRMKLEADAMRTAFGSTFRLNRTRDGLLYWEGAVEVNLAGLAQREHILKILYPASYPERPAEAYCIRPEIYSEKHQYRDGQLCLFNPRDGVRYGWNPATSLAVTVAGWAIQWLYAYYTWRATGSWPGVEERVDPNTPLPPGRGVR